MSRTRPFLNKRLRDYRTSVLSFPNRLLQSSYPSLRKSKLFPNISSPLLMILKLPAGKLALWECLALFPEGCEAAEAAEAGSSCARFLITRPYSSRPRFLITRPYSFDFLITRPYSSRPRFLITRPYSSTRDRGFRYMLDDFFAMTAILGSAFQCCFRVASSSGWWSALTRAISHEGRRLKEEIPLITGNQGEFQPKNLLHESRHYYEP